MREYLPFIIIGLTTGGVYALASLGLVLTYRTSGVFNFAHGAIGMFATYAFYSLRQQVPTAVAVVVAVGVVAPLMGVVIDRLFAGRLQQGGPIASIVASLGLLVGLQGLAVVLYGPELRQMAPIFPRTTFRVGSLFVGFDQTLVVVVALLAAVALIGYFRFTHRGLETRAVVDNRDLAGLVGTNAGRVTRSAWMLGSAFAAMSGILFSPFVGLDSILLTLLVVEAFGAAAVGGLRSFPKTMAAAFGLGLAQSLATKIVAQTGIRSLDGLPTALPFLLLFGVLLVSGRGALREVGTAVVRGGVRRADRVPARSIAAVVVGAMALVPFLSDSRLLTLTTTVAFILVFSSLSLLVGLSRQLSLVHAVFVVFGATNLAHLQSAGVPYVIALPLAALLIMPVGAAMALPAIRLSGLYLALATFGFGILAQNLLFPTGLAFGVRALVTIDRPGFISSDSSFFFFVLAVVTAGVIAVELVRVSRLGRILLALADSPAAVGSLGLNQTATRLVAFCLSAFLAAIAGGLLGTLVQSVNPTSFTFFHSLLWVTVLVAAGARTFGGAVVASVLLVTVPAVITGRTVTEWQPIVFGAAAIFLSSHDNGLMGLLHRVPERLRAAWSQVRDGTEGAGPGVRRAWERYARHAGVEDVATEGANR